MTSLSYAVADSATMLRRNLKRMQRYPAMTLVIIMVPVVFLLLFVYVFGGTLGAGLGHLGDGRAAYLRYVTPGIILLTLGTQATSTAVSVAMDMSAGIIARFRTMAIARASVLTGHVLGSVIQSLLGIAFVIGIAVAMGFRTTADPLAWLAAIGVLVLIAGRFNLPVGRLPGDIVYRGKHTVFYFPLATSIVLSVVLTLVFWLISHIRR